MHSLHTDSAHALRYRTECCTHPAQPESAIRSSPRRGTQDGAKIGKRSGKGPLCGPIAAPLLCSGVDGGERLLCPSREAGTEGYP